MKILIERETWKRLEPGKQVRNRTPFHCENPPDSLTVLHKHSIVYVTPLTKLNTALTRQGLGVAYERGSLKRDSVFVAVARQNKTTGVRTM